MIPQGANYTPPDTDMMESCALFMENTESGAGALGACRLLTQTQMRTASASIGRKGKARRDGMVPMDSMATCSSSTKAIIKKNQEVEPGSLSRPSADLPLLSAEGLCACQ